jgi:virulence factor
MIKIGVIGLGQIAQKAYLPVITQHDVELHFFTRNEDTLSRLGRQYGVTHLHSSLESMIDSGIEAAFVHAPTAAHETLIEKLLSANVHVFVDKPVTYDYPSTERMVALAQKKNRLLTVGFNRRFAPCYQKLKELQDPNMILMQKNRRSLPGDVRTFIFDDFIHVVDTVLYLFPNAVETMTVTGRKKEGLLYHVTLQLVASNGATAIGIMNRDSGTTEERVEVFAAEEKRVVQNFSELIIQQNKTEIRSGTDDWESTVQRRGFVGMIASFLQSLTDTATGHYSEILTTHKLCEEIVNKLNKGKG